MMVVAENVQRIAPRTWIELRGKRLWGHYCPQTRQLRFERGNERDVFDLAEYDETGQEPRQPIDAPV